MSPTAEPEDEFAWYLEFRNALEQIQGEFSKYAGLAPRLYHRVFFSPDDPLAPESWSTFIQANQDRDNWECWEQSQDGDTCGCYFGEQKHLEDFQRLAQSGYAVLSNLKYRIDQDLPVPSGTKLLLPSIEGHLGWLDLVHDTADFGASLLRERLGFWQFPDACTEDDVPVHYRHLHGANGDCRYPAHPFFRELQHDLFLSSVQAIGIWLLADNAVSIGTFQNDPPVALPTNQEDSVLQVSPAECLSEMVSQPTVSKPTRLETEGLKPTWDEKLNQLRFRNRVIRRYKNPAGAQTDLLQQFQQADWPPILDDPFEIAKIGSKFEAAKVTHKRRNVVDQLNKGQDDIDFACDQSGKAVTWQWRAKPEMPLAPPTT